MNDSQGITVSEVSMEEWAMLAFRAERAPRRAPIRVAKAAPNVTPTASGVGGARTIFWLLLAAAMSTTLLFV